MVLSSAVEAGFHETPETEAMFRRHLPVKEAIALEDWNRFAAIFDIDGMSWSDRCADVEDAHCFADPAAPCLPQSTDHGSCADEGSTL